MQDSWGCTPLTSAQVERAILSRSSASPQLRNFRSSWLFAVKMYTRLRCRGEARLESVPWENEMEKCPNKNFFFNIKQIKKILCLLFKFTHNYTKHIIGSVTFQQRWRVVFDDFTHLYSRLEAPFSVEVHNVGVGLFLIAAHCTDKIIGRRLNTVYITSPRSIETLFAILFI